MAGSGMRLRRQSQPFSTATDTHTHRLPQRIRYGLYAPIRNFIGVDAHTSKADIPLWKKFVAGGSAGALAAFVATPTDLLKVRRQQEYDSLADRLIYRSNRSGCKWTA